MNNYIDSVSANSYWEKRYRNSGTSGAGSIGAYRDWKWAIISKHAGRVDHVVDVGCGDLSFWEGKTCQTYTGIDISPTILGQNRQQRPSWTFICSDASVSQDVRAPVVFCFDILFHILDDRTYEAILANLIRYSDEWIFLYTWVNNPLTAPGARKQIFLDGVRELKFGPVLQSLLGTVTTDGKYQKYRDFTAYVPLFERRGFKLVSMEKYPYDDIGGMYIFRKTI